MEERFEGGILLIAPRNGKYMVEEEERVVELQDADLIEDGTHDRGHGEVPIITVFRNPKALLDCGQVRRTYINVEAGD